MDLIYHAFCFDGALSFDLVALYELFFNNKLISEQENPDFVSNIAFQFSKLPLFWKIDEKSVPDFMKKESKSATGDLSKEDLKNLVQKSNYHIESSNISYHGLKVDSYNKIIDEILKVPQNKKKEILLIVDAHTSVENIRKLQKMYNIIVIIDHHLTLINMIEELENEGISNLRIVYSENNSASFLTYITFLKIMGPIGKILNPNAMEDICTKIAYIDAKDTSVPKDDETNAFNEQAYLMKLNIVKSSVSFSFKLELILPDTKSIVEAGLPRLAGKKDYIEKKLLKFNKYRVFIKNSENVEETVFSCYGKIISQDTKYQGEIGEFLALKSIEEGESGLAVLIKVLDNQRTYLSLRSTGKDGFDCERLAKLYGGGGHRNASGCMMKPWQFEKIFKKI